MASYVENLEMQENITIPYIWKKVDKPYLDFTDKISEMIYRYERQNSGCLPNLKYSDTIYIFSDYSGSHKDSSYDAYSFLFCDLKNSTSFIEDTSNIRYNTQLKDRRVTFRNLNDKVRASVIDRFFEASEGIHGLLFTILIDKEIDNFFSPEELNSIKKMFPELKKCKDRPFEKSLRIIHLINLILSGLSCPGQNLYWFTDEDEILCHVQRHITITNLFALVSGLYFENEMGHFKLGSTEYSGECLLIEDLCSIPDLASGGLCELINCNVETMGRLYNNISLNIPNSLSYKSKRVLNWLSDECFKSNLKKINMIIRNENGRRIFNFIDLIGKNPFIWI